MTDDLAGPTKDIVLGDGWSIEDPSAPNFGRRTLVAASTWTVPAMGVEVDTPVAAASVTLPVRGAEDAPDLTAR